MPRPTAAQLVYGSCTVIFSTLAMLLLSRTSSGVGVAVIALVALALGLLVAMTVPLPKARTTEALPGPPSRRTRSSGCPRPCERPGERPAGTRRRRLRDVREAAALLCAAGAQPVLTTTVLAALSCSPCL